MVCDLTPVSQNNCSVRMLLQYHMQTNHLGSQMVPCTCRRVPLQETFLHRILTGKGYDYENTSESDKNHYADDTQSIGPDDYTCEASSFLHCHRRLLSQETSATMDSSTSPPSSSSSPFRLNPRRHFNRAEPFSVIASSVSSPSLSPLSPRHFSSMECTSPHPEEMDSSSPSYQSSSFPSH